MALKDFLDNDKNFSSLSLTLCDMLGENTFDRLVQLDVAGLVYPCQPNLDDISNHPLSCPKC